MSRCTWTGERPTIDGYYWWRSTSGSRNEVIARLLGNRLVAFHTAYGHVEYSIDEVGGEWFGPLEVPE